MSEKPIIVEDLDGPLPRDTEHNRRVQEWFDDLVRSRFNGRIAILGSRFPSDRFQ